MIYACDNCRFLFTRTGAVDSCPDCGKPTIRTATDEERDEFERRRNGQKSNILED